jgi:Fusaric acid resistance protein-like
MLIPQAAQRRYFTKPEISFCMLERIHSTTAPQCSSLKARRRLVEVQAMCLIGLVDPRLSGRIEVLAYRGFVVGIHRHALQTQFPPSRIELGNSSQFHFPSSHSVSTIAAATNPIATPIKGLSTATRKKCSKLSFQESVFSSCHFLKHSEIDISERIENFFCTRSCQDWFASKIMRRMKLWSWQKENLPSIAQSVRTALAATASVIVARLVQMPEAYWAAIATLVVMQSSLGATLTLSIERVVATALGASVGAVEANYFGANLAAFMLAIFFIGLLSYGFRLEKTAYRYASVTLTIIVLIPRTNPAWIVGLHRFIEVSVGIVVALLVVAIWPERHPVPAKSAEE